jgi:uncharacterized integral membrane protein
LIYIKIAVLIAVIVAGILFGVSNQQGASLKFFYMATKEIPLYLILFGAFVSGAVISFIYNTIAAPELRQRQKKLTEEIKELEKTLAGKKAEKETLRADIQKTGETADAKASCMAQKP